MYYVLLLFYCRIGIDNKVN